MVRFLIIIIIFCLIGIVGLARANAINDLIWVSGKDTPRYAFKEYIPDLEPEVASFTRPLSVEMRELNQIDVCHRLADMCWRDKTHQRRRQFNFHPDKNYPVPASFTYASGALLNFAGNSVDNRNQSSSGVYSSSQQFSDPYKFEAPKPFQDYLRGSDHAAISEFVNEVKTGETVADKIKRRTRTSQSNYTSGGAVHEPSDLMTHRNPNHLQTVIFSMLHFIITLMQVLFSVPGMLMVLFALIFALWLKSNKQKRSGHRRTSGSRVHRHAAHQIHPSTSKPRRRRRRRRSRSFVQPIPATAP